MRRILNIALICALLLIATVATRAEVIAIVGGRVVAGDGAVYDPGTVLIEDGLILAVGAGVEVPDGAAMIDATGLWVWPGMIDPYTSLGLVEVGAERMTNDADEATAVAMPQLRAVDGINPYSALIPVARLGGVTTVLVSPGSRNPINGQAAIINLAGATVEEMLVADGVALVFNFGSRAARDGSYPSTRIGIVASIRQTLYDARRYGRQREAALSRSNEDSEEEEAEDEDARPGSAPKTDLRYEALLAALRGEIQVICAASETQEIRAALAVAEEFGLRVILLNPAHAYRMADEIERRGVTVLLGNTFRRPAQTERYDRYYSLAATLHGAGIPFAFTTGSAHGVRTLRTHAGMAVAFGLPEEAAVAALTLQPARMLGIDDRAGSLAPGKVANVVLWNGNPLQSRSSVVRLFIRGEEIPPVSRQERLRDRFSREIDGQ